MLAVDDPFIFVDKPNAIHALLNVIYKFIAFLYKIVFAIAYRYRI